MTPVPKTFRDRAGNAFTEAGLKERLAKHADYRVGCSGGVRLDLADANLAGANLARANLAGADLAGANLARADLAGANLAGANLARANLAGADLADANLADANLAGANLADANLAGANLAGAEGLEEKQTAQFRILPDDGTVVGWKKLRDGKLACLEIGPGVPRLNAYGSRKCRAASALVVAVYDSFGALVGEGSSTFSKSFVYRPGARVEPVEAFSDDATVECASGIHFFITRTEAELY